MKRNYDECVTKYSDSFVRVVLDPGYVSRIQNFVTELVEAKSKEDHHKIDSNKEVKRFTTGFLGEAALEKLFGIPIIDWTIGYSGLYHMTEFFSNIELGVDTFKTINGNEFTVTSVDDKHINISIPGNATVNKLTLSLDEVRKMLESGQKFDKIKDVTTFFGKSYDRQKVIEQNKKNAVRHAYFREYLALQRLAYMFRFDARNGDLKEA